MKPPGREWERRIVERPVLVVACAVLLGTAIRVALASTTLGTNDVAYWTGFMDWVVTRDSFSIYEGIPYYNHPPMMSGYLWLAHHFESCVPTGFPLLIRLPAILSDAISAFVVLRLGRSVFGERRAILGAILVPVSPVLIQVSGFHGNTDPVFLLFLLLATERLVLARSAAAAGFFLGLAINVKVVPLLFVPFFFFALRGRRERAVFVATTAAVFVAGFGVHLVVAYPYIERNIFAYSGNLGIWGTSKLFAVFTAGRGLAKFAALLKPCILLTTAVLSAGWFKRFPEAGSGAAWRLQVLRGVGLVTLFFFSVTPGFGVQYLAWLTVLGLFLRARFVVVWQALAGTFLFLVYTYWCGGLPWHYANSDVVGQWTGAASALDWVMWLFTMAWFAVEMGWISNRRLRAAV